MKFTALLIFSLSLTLSAFAKHRSEKGDGPGNNLAEVTFFQSKEYQDRFGKEAGFGYRDRLSLRLKGTDAKLMWEMLRTEIIPFKYIGSYDLEMMYYKGSEGMSCLEYHSKGSKSISYECSLSINQDGQLSEEGVQNLEWLEKFNKNQWKRL